MRTADNYKAQFAVGRITRREFTRALAGLGLTGSAIVPLLGQGPSAKAATPIKGGRLRVMMQEGNASDTLDPAKATSSVDVIRINSIFNRLVHVTPDLQPTGELAESFEANATADEWVFTLRKGIEFHDGRPLRAADVMYSIQRMIDPATGSGAKALFDQIDLSNSKVDGDQVVRVKLKAPNADMPALFHDYHAQIVPEGFTDFDKAIGTGPFKLKSFEAGVQAVVERNPNYWKEGLPYVDEVETTGLPDPVSRLNALLAGEIDIMEGLDASLLDKVTNSPELQLLSAKSGRHLEFAMHCEVGPYNNPDVRNALKYLVDREKFVQVVLKGQGQVGNDHSIAPIDPWYCADIPIRPHDPDQAKFLLRKAGASDLTFDLSTAPVAAGMLEGALVLQEMANQAGVKINVLREAPDSYWSAVWLKKSFVTSNWNQRPTADMMLSIAYLSTAEWNDTHWKRPDFDKIVIEARGTLDPVKRKELYCEAQRMIHDDGGYIIPSFMNILDACRSNVKGVGLHPLGPLGFWMMDQVWIEA